MTSIARASAVLFILSLPIFAHEKEQQKLLASDGKSGDGFGRSVAIDTTTLVVGAPGNDGQGAAYVFVFDSLSGRWYEQAKLVAIDGAPGDRFGASVAVQGNLAVVGAPGSDGGAPDAGAAYLFQYTQSTWTQTAELLPNRSGAFDGFGTSVALDHATVVVGAPRTHSPTTASGRAYTFAPSSASWSQTSVLFAAGGASGNQFGRSVSIVGSVIAVGAPTETARSPRSGAAYSFARSGSNWIQSAKIVDRAGNNGDFFGLALDLSGETLLVVGAPGDDNNGSGSGSTFTFRKSGSGWATTQKRVGSGSGDRSGGTVSHSIRTTLIGARFDDDSAPDAGIVAIHITFAQGEVASLFDASDANSNARLGSSVAASPCWHVAGATGHRELGSEAGAAYVYVVEGRTRMVNGSGVNPVCATTVSPPNIGSTWEIDVDGTQLVGFAFSQVFVRDRLLSQPESYSVGELLIDPTSRHIAQSGIVGSGVARHSFALPLDPAIIGYRVAMQAVIYTFANGFPQPILCNAETVRVGCFESAQAPSSKSSSSSEE